MPPSTQAVARSPDSPHNSADFTDEPEAAASGSLVNGRGLVTLEQ